MEQKKSNSRTFSETNRAKSDGGKIGLPNPLSISSGEGCS
jgi:hypothetical protein